MRTVFLTGAVVLYVLMVIVVGWRMGKDEVRRSAAGAAVVAGEEAAAARWRAVARGEAVDDPSLARLSQAADALGWEAILASNRPELRGALRELLSVPPPDRRSAEVAIRAAEAERSLNQALERALDESPLAATRWREAPSLRPGEREAAPAVDAFGAPAEEASFAGAQPVSDAGLPWGEAAIQGGILQELGSHPEWRPPLASVGAMRRDVAALVGPWCLGDLERLDLAPCRPLDRERIPDPEALLADDDAPSQLAVVWAASQLPPQQLWAMVEDRARSEGTRRRALMAYARAAPREEAIAALTPWLLTGDADPPFGPPLAALELLRLRAAPAAPTIRLGAARQGPAEAVLMAWIADVLEDPSVY